MAPALLRQRKTSASATRSARPARSTVPAVKGTKAARTVRAERAARGARAARVARVARVAARTATRTAAKVVAMAAAAAAVSTVTVAATPAAPARAATASGAFPSAPAPDPPATTCAGSGSGSGGTAAEFPLGIRLHGGPDGGAYPAGGPLQDLTLDLTNTTDASCVGVHPVLVLADQDRETALRPDQIRLEFYDGGASRWRPVALEATQEAENVGAFTESGGFGGFTVLPGRTLTVPVRLGFRADADPDEVVVTAAAVQRRGADGDWIGESGATGGYRLTVGPAEAGDGPGTSTEPGGRPRPADPADPAAPPGKERPSGPGTSVGRPELAHTGAESGEDAALALAPFSAALILVGAGLVRTVRRHRRAADGVPHP
ncbi:hypothetical protein [Streptomyces sp. NPDC056144]|uniref:hypothetical protein n=1 Tax=unclassified Streptomyces TaxID=2593676 RepID=UPI0035D681F7